MRRRERVHRRRLPRQLFHRHLVRVFQRHRGDASIGLLRDAVRHAQFSSSSDDIYCHVRTPVRLVPDVVVMSGVVVVR